MLAVVFTTPLEICTYLGVFWEPMVIPWVYKAITFQTKPRRYACAGISKHRVRSRVLHLR